MEREQLYQFLNTGERMQLKGLVKPEVQEPAADSRKFDLGESVKAEQHSSEAPQKSDFDSMIRRDGDKWSCINCGKVHILIMFLHIILTQLLHRLVKTSTTCLAMCCGTWRREKLSLATSVDRKADRAMV